MMRLITLLITIALYQANATTYAQVTIRVKQAPIRQILEKVSRQTGYDLIFIDQDLENAQPVDLNVRDVPLKTALAKIFEHQPLRYELTDHTIMIKRNPDAVPAVGATGNTWVQQGYITGRVLNDTDQPLQGATVYLLDKEGKRTGQQTGTDEKGNFRLAYANASIDHFFVEVVFMGYAARRLPAKAEMGAVMLEAQTTAMDDVVVTGIFSRPLENFTGSATSIKGEDLKKANPTNIFKGIAALDPAFNIVTNNTVGGNINQMPEIQIRGQNSFPTLSDEITTNPNQPLFILDGFEVDISRIKDLDINTIESIVLLKDASATTIYGSRGANGVMVINTLTPESGKLRVSVTNDLSMSTPDLSVYSLLDAYEKLDFEQRVGVYSDPDPNISYALEQHYNERLKAVTTGVNTDWRNLPVQTGISNRTSVSLSGGDQTVRYGLLVGANIQNGVMKKQDRSNYSGQFDISYLLKKVRFSNSARVYQTNANESPYGSFGTYLSMNPYWSPYDENGEVAYYLENFTATGSYAYTRSQTNPLYNASLNVIDRTKSFGFQNNLNIRYDIIPGLFYEAKLGFSKELSSSDVFLPGNHTSFDNVADASLKGRYSKGQTERLNYEFANYLNLSKRWDKHLLFGTLSAELGSRQTDLYRMVAVGFPTDNLDHILYASQYAPDSRPTGSEGKINRVGFLLNGNYSYDNRYLLDVSLRRDGSSAYGTNRKFGNFWSVGAGWNIHHESFFQENDQINQIKLRTTYGITGSLEIPAYSSQTQYGYTGDFSYEGNLGVSMMTIGNPNLGWQQKRELNIGADVQLFRSRLNLRVEYYNATTSQALTQLNLAPSVGFDRYYENFGKINNKGVEAALQYKVLQRADQQLNWIVFANGLHNKNTLLEISDNLKSLNQTLNSVSNTIPNFLFEEGKSTTSIFAVRSLGIDPATGSEVYLKKDGRTKTYTWSAEDKIAFGNTLPSVQGTFGSNLFYKGFELGLMFDYQFGGQLYNQTLVDRVENIDPRFNVDRRAYDLGWSGPGDVAIYRRVSAIQSVRTLITTRFVEDNNTLNLNSLSIGYLFTDQPFVSRLGINTLRLRATTVDVARWSSVQIERGTANPFARMYSLSIQASF